VSLTAGEEGHPDRREGPVSGPLAVGRIKDRASNAPARGYNACPVRKMRAHGSLKPSGCLRGLVRPPHAHPAFAAIRGPGVFFLFGRVPAAGSLCRRPSTEARRTSQPSSGSRPAARGKWWKRPERAEKRLAGSRLRPPVQDAACFSRRRWTEDGIRMASRYLATVRRAMSMPESRRTFTIVSSERTSLAGSSSMSLRMR